MSSACCNAALTRVAVEKERTFRMKILLWFTGLTNEETSTFETSVNSYLKTLRHILMIAVRTFLDFTETKISSPLSQKHFLSF